LKDNLINYIRKSILEKEISLIGVSELDYYREYDSLIDTFVDKIHPNH